MIESTENMQAGLQPDKEMEGISLFGGKIKLNMRQLSLCKIFVPLVFILICAVVAWVMLTGALQSGSNIDGKFANYANSDKDYIEIDSDGEYTWFVNGKKEGGNWTLNGNSLTFKAEDRILEGQLVERKYIVFNDENFLSGEVSTAPEAEAEVTAPDGTVYGFGPDGKFYSIVDGAYMEIGSYIADGYFIIVTTSEGNITYLNCGDGITSVFYQAV